MKPKRKEYDFNGGWTSGDANHHISKKNSERVHNPKDLYSRKVKHKNKGLDFGNKV